MVAGVDEAGRGPLAGPVVAAAVILDNQVRIEGVDDSKKLSANRRASLEVEIKATAICWSVASATVEEIDRLNILNATMLAMKRAVMALNITPAHVLVDGNRLPQLEIPATAVVGGDGIHQEIAAASILAKQSRDRDMIELAKLFPQYGFEKHKGYPTKNHIEVLRNFGITIHHRRSFSPVSELIET
jgi:ribonuclease HII